MKKTPISVLYSTTTLLTVNTTKQISLTKDVQTTDLLLFIFRLSSINRRYTVPIYLNLLPSNFSIILGPLDEVIATCYNKAKIDLVYQTLSGSTAFTDLYIDYIYLWNR